MEYNEYLQMVYEEADLFLAEHEELLLKSFEDELLQWEVVKAIDERSGKILCDAEDASSLIFHSELKAKDPKWWQTAQTWDAAVISVGMHCLEHDILKQAISLLKKRQDQ